MQPLPHVESKVVLLARTMGEHRNHFLAQMGSLPHILQHSLPHPQYKRRTSRCAVTKFHRSNSIRDGGPGKPKLAVLSTKTEMPGPLVPDPESSLRAWRTSCRTPTSTQPG